MKKLKKNILVGKASILKILFYFILLNMFFSVFILANADDKDKKFLEIKILDKVSSKSSLIKLKINKEKKFQNLMIKSLKCKNSKFDDNPEITAYLQVKDLTNINNDEVFVFNGWTFLSSPTINPFDHPVYDIWLSKCY
jgi:hypothetical protein